MKRRQWRDKPEYLLACLKQRSCEIGQFSPCRLEHPLKEGKDETK